MTVRLSEWQRLGGLPIGPPGTLKLITYRCDIHVILCLKPIFHYADLLVTSATKPWRPRWFVRDVADFLLTCRRVADFPVSPTQTGLSREFFKPSRHVATVWNPETSPWLPRSMIYVGDFPVTSCRLPRNFPVIRVFGKFRGSVCVMEFGLEYANYL